MKDRHLKTDNEHQLYLRLSMTVNAFKITKWKNNYLKRAFGGKGFGWKEMENNVGINTFLLFVSFLCREGVNLWGKLHPFCGICFPPKMDKF